MDELDVNVLFIFQLPDALPGHGTESEPADSAESQVPNQPQENLCTMHNLEEGKIGRLVRYRSGKMKLLLGDSKFDIDLGIDPNLLQEVISTQINKSERSGQVINLGEINAKLSAVPDWEFMLNNIADKKSQLVPRASQQHTHTPHPHIPARHYAVLLPKIVI